MEQMDETVQDATVLEGACKKHTATVDKDGIKPEQIEILSTQRDEASLRDTEQKNAVEKVGNLTIQQNKKMDEAGALVHKISEAAKGEYGEDDKAKMKEFHVGRNRLTTVKAMTSELKYLKGVAVLHKDDLAKHGVKDSDIALLDTIGAELSNVDTEQETAKKVRKASTRKRNDAMDALRKTMRKIRHSANSIFADQPSVLTEFEPIQRGGGPGGGKNNQTPPPDQPKQ